MNRRARKLRKQEAAIPFPTVQDDMMQHSSAVPQQSVNEVSSIVQEVFSSDGQPLDTETQVFMESRFGHDFSQVRVHTDERAAESTRAVNALAYTVGRDIVFGEGHYAPGTSEGKSLLAHELVHTMQQQHAYTSPAPSSLIIGAPDDIAEREAANISLPAQAGASGILSQPSTSRQETGILRRQTAQAFKEEQVAPVREAFEENAEKKGKAKESCISILNTGLRKLFESQLKGKKLGSTIQATMARLQALNLADQPLMIEFLDERGQITKGTRAPASLSKSVKDAALSATGTEAGWYLFALSIMDGYHSVLLAVDNRVPGTPKMYWMDQIYSGFDDVTEKLDARITSLTKSWWSQVKRQKNVGFKTTVRLWPIKEHILGDFPTAETTEARA